MAMLRRTDLLLLFLRKFLWVLFTPWNWPLHLRRINKDSCVTYRKLRELKLGHSVHRLTNRHAFVIIPQNIPVLHFDFYNHLMPSDSVISCFVDGTVINGNGRVAIMKATLPGETLIEVRLYY
jgi:hypothetical protein